MNLPDYMGGSIVNLMASLQQGMGGGASAYPFLRQLSPDAVTRYRQVILWVIDGLGYDYLRAHPEAQHLNDALVGPMTSVYPPTTASAITTFLTGDAPQQHGVTGWYVYFKELGAVMTVLPGSARYGGTGYDAGVIDATRLLQHRPFSDKIAVESFSLSPRHIVDSAFNRAHLGSARAIGYQGLQELHEQVLRLTAGAGKRFLYLYWPELDSIGHHFGMGSRAASEHLLELDLAFRRMQEGLKGRETLLLVCADHGQIDSDPKQTLVLNELPDLQNTLVLPLCGEPRSAYCYLRSGCEAQFDEIVATRFSELITAYPSSQLIEAGWFGLGEPHPGLLDRIGDRVLLMQDHAILRDSLAGEKYYPLVGVHGGLSREELLVPFISVAC